jgi:hypothetical protein
MMMLPETKHLGNEKGQATFEFMLIIPAFIVFALLVFDFGIGAFQYITVTNAVREGARYGSVNCGTGTCCETGTCPGGNQSVQERTIAKANGLLSGTDNWTIRWIDRNSSGLVYERGDSVRVKVEHSHRLLFFPVTIKVAACADMRLEQNDNNHTTLPSGSGEC